MKTRGHFRCFNNNGTVGRILVFCPLVVFLIATIVRLKRSVYVMPEYDRSLGQSKVAEEPRHNSNAVLKFPMVNEFKLGKSIRKFDNEDARLIGFPVKDYENITELNSSTKIIYLATPYFSKWNPLHYYFPHLGNVTFTRYSCPIDNCFVTRNPALINKADAVLFHVRDLEVYNIPSYRSPEQIWILYSMEPPWLEVKDMRRFEGLFNWTMSYRRGSDVLVKYGFIGKRKRRNRKIKLPNAIPKYKMDRAVWFVSNCNTDSNREHYVKRLKKIFPVDVIGGCGMKGCRPAETRKCYTQTVYRYKFYLAFENAICEDYVTEKLFNILEYFVIPVTLGGANYSNLTPRNSIINAMEFESPEQLGRYLWDVSKNDSLYLSYFSWKDTYRSYLQPWMCDLCEVLHGTATARSKTIYNLEKWWNGDKSCLRWTGIGFKPIKRHEFPKYHLKLF